MFVSGFRYIVTIMVCASLVFSPLVFAADLSLPSGDLIAPKVIHEKFTKPLAAGSNLQIKAIVKDNVGVQSVTLFYRAMGASEYKRAALQPTDVEDEYGVTLGQKDLTIPGIEYYIQAIDLAGNTLLHGYAFSPLRVNIVPDASQATSSYNDPEYESEPSTAAPEEETQKKGKSSYRWLWIGLGALAVGAIAAAASSGGGGNTEPSAAKDSTLIVTAPAPGN